MYVASQTSPSRPLWLWLNLLSLDAPLIAVLWMNLFAAAFHVGLRAYVSLTLGLVVWLIYVADRILDAAATTPVAQSARHGFHRVHRTALLVTMVLALVPAAYACTQLDAYTFRAGLILSFAIAVYFVAVHSLRLRLPKEAVVAVLFAVGVSFTVGIRVASAAKTMAVSIILFMALCWLNLVLIERCEWLSFMSEGDAAPHASTRLAGRHLSWFAAALALISAALSAMVSSPSESALFLAMALSATALVFLSVFRRQLSIELIRVLADAALLTPAFVLPFLIK